MNKQKRNKTYPIYRFIRWLVWLFYPKITLEGTDNIPSEPCIFVGNHAQMNGPICSVVHFPVDALVWCAGELMALKTDAFFLQDHVFSGGSFSVRPV